MLDKPVKKPIATTFLAALLLSTGCVDRASRIPRYDKVPAFQMTTADNRVFTEKDLDGKVWIVDFIYTNCPAECPRMSSRMHELEKQTEGAADVKLLSVSVDPDRDTPEALKAFAGHYGAPNARWNFITGTADTVHLLAFQTFHVGDVIGRIEHSSKFALVDKRRTVRGYYSSFNREELATMLTDIEALRKERP